MADSANSTSRLRELRDSIDNIDAAIVHMLAERFRCTQAVGILKAHHRLPSRLAPTEKRRLARRTP